LSRPGVLKLMRPQNMPKQNKFLGSDERPLRAAAHVVTRFPYRLQREHLSPDLIETKPVNQSLPKIEKRERQEYKQNDAGRLASGDFVHANSLSFSRSRSRNLSATVSERIPTLNSSATAAGIA